MNSRRDYIKDESTSTFTIDRSKASTASRTVSTRSKKKGHNNLVSRANMGDVDLVSTMGEFMKQMAARQTALEEQMANLSIIVQGVNNG